MAVDDSARATALLFTCYLAGEENLVIFTFRTCLSSILKGRVRIVNGEDTLCPRMGCTGTDALSIGFHSANQTQSGEKHGFSCASFTGDGGHSHRWVDESVVDRAEVSNFKFSEHRSPQNVMWHSGQRRPLMPRGERTRTDGFSVAIPKQEGRTS